MLDRAHHFYSSSLFTVLATQGLAAPVVFPSSLILEKLGPTAYHWYGLYPMAGVIEGFRAAIVPNKAMPWELIGMGSISAVLLFAFGLWYFKKMERHFADVA